MVERRPRARAARVFGVGVVALALVEWGLAARVYKHAVAPADWHEAGQAVAGIPPDEAVALADTWLGPRARAQMERFARPEALARPDLRGAARVHVLGVQGRSWSPKLEADREDLPQPVLEQARDFGGLTLSTWTLPGAGTVLADFVDDLLSLRVASQGRKCSGRRTWKCPAGRVHEGWAEIEYRPRRCLLVEMSDGAGVEITYEDMPLGTTLRGHVGVHDFNRRLRSDAPTAVAVAIGERRVDFTATDTQGWHAFAVDTRALAGTKATVTLEVVPGVRGTWQRKGYDAGKVHAVCIELRSLDEPAAEPVAGPSAGEAAP